MTAACTTLVPTAPKREAPAGLAGVVSMCVVTHIPEDRDACIAAAAYLIAKRRGFVPGHELDDWLQAEREVDARLIGEGCAY